LHPRSSLTIYKFDAMDAGSMGNSYVSTTCQQEVFKTTIQAMMAYTKAK
jgi:hypothetical protein